MGCVDSFYPQNSYFQQITFGGGAVIIFPEILTFHDTINYFFTAPPRQSHPDIVEVMKLRSPFDLWPVRGWEIGWVTFSFITLFPFPPFNLGD